MQQSPPSIPMDHTNEDSEQQQLMQKSGVGVHLNDDLPLAATTAEGRSDERGWLVGDGEWGQSLFGLIERFRFLPFVISIAIFLQFRCRNLQLIQKTTDFESKLLAS